MISKINFQINALEELTNNSKLTKITLNQQLKIISDKMIELSSLIENAESNYFN